MMQSNGIRKIGLTGGIAAGKSTVTAYLLQRGIPVLDADAVSHELTAPNAVGTKRIAEAFGEEYAPGGVLDRKKLGALVFSDADAREKLNGILHPLIFSKIRAQAAALEAAGESCVLIDVPLLFETGADALVDEIWCVDAPLETRIARLMSRDGMTRSEALARIAAQMDDEERRMRSDHVIDNGGTREETVRQVEKLLNEGRHRFEA